MSNSIRLLDVVALTEDLPQRGLGRGQVGTVVEALAPEVFEVEFNDDEGRTYALLALRRSVHGLALSTVAGGLTGAWRSDTTERRAAFFLLYGIDRKGMDAILDTFSGMKDGPALPGMSSQCRLVQAAYDRLSE